LRLFIGLELDAPVRTAAAAVIDRLEARLQAAAPDFRARWIPSANLHLTVWFLGEVADRPAALLMEQLRAPLPVAAFELELRGCGAFPRGGPPRILWIGTGAGAEGMAHAYGELARRLSPLGYAPEARPYSPHLTIARLKDPGRGVRTIRETLAAEPATCGRMAVRALTLFRSRLSPHGAVYEPLQRVPLG
jgi:2'-5' RNA ligase